MIINDKFSRKDVFSKNLKSWVMVFLMNLTQTKITSNLSMGLPWWLTGKESMSIAVDMASIPGSGRSPRKINGNPLQYSCLENPMDRRICWATVYGVAKELDTT